MRAARSWIFASCSLALLLGACALAPASDIQRLEQRLSNLERRGFSGQVLVMQGEQVLLKRAYGSRDAASSEPLTITDVMPLASVTKPFTASLILALAADGMIDSEAPVTHYIPELGDAWQAASIRHLLTHTAGLPAEIHNRGWDGHPRFEPVDRDTFIARVARFRPDHAPGTRFNYSNVGYGMLGAVIETVTGEDWETALAQRLLEPCGIDDIGVLRPAWDAAGFVSGRQGRADWGSYFDQPRLEDGFGWNLRASGDLHATIDGVEAWWRCLLSGRWLPVGAMAQWLVPEVADPGGDWYGPGLEIGSSPHGPVVGHAGGNRVFAADWRWSPETGVMTYIATADDRHQADLLYGRLLAGFAGEIRINE